MRQVGTIDLEADAQRFAEYLLTINVSTRVLHETTGYSIWVRDESQIDRAKSELAAFLANRSDPKYAAAAPLAREIKKVEAAREERTRRNVVDMRQHWRNPSIRQTPFMWLLIFLSFAVTLYSGFGQVTPQDAPGRAAFLDKIWIAPPPLIGQFASLDAVLSGEVWRLVTPILLHLSIMHLLFNMMWVFHLGRAVEMIDGTWRFVLLVLVIAVTSNVAQFYLPNLEVFLQPGPGRVLIIRNPFFGGMSGVVYGLFGYIWIRSRRDPLSRYHMDDQTVLLMIVWFFVCLFDLVGPVANTAHGVGLLVGMAIGYGTAKYRLHRLRG
jgi:GlpG protein